MFQKLQNTIHHFNDFLFFQKLKLMAQNLSIVFQKFSCTRLEGELRVRRTDSYVVEKFDR